MFSNEWNDLLHGMINNLPAKNVAVQFGSSGSNTIIYNGADTKIIPTHLFNKQYHQNLVIIRDANHMPNPLQIDCLQLLSKCSKRPKVTPIPPNFCIHTTKATKNVSSDQNWLFQPHSVP
eukprot:312928_1